MQSPSSGGVRFAPSPTGKFHVGNLRTAWISYQLAKLYQLPWVVRFEDIDSPRVVAGAREDQTQDLYKLGLKADLELLQSEFRDRHWSTFKRAVDEKQIYACDCSRKEVQAALSTMASAPHTVAPTYSGRCRTMDGRVLEASETLAWRFKMDDPSGKDDFIIARTSKELDSKGIPHEPSFTPSYHWACAIDDHDGNYDLLVRSSDLRESLAPQRAIQNWLGRKQSIPVFHTALVTQNDGRRLEKRTAGVTLLELEEDGIHSQKLIQLFSRSFELKVNSFSIDPMFGEVNQTLSLLQLGL